MFANKYGIQSLLKDGGKHYAGVDEALLKNIAAAKAIAEITKSSLGPYGMNKLIVNHLDRHFVTSDTATMLQQLEVQHPAAKILVMASHAQEQECGDATNLSVMLAGELLGAAEELLKQGIHSSDIIRGYELAAERAVAALTQLGCWSVPSSDLKNGEVLEKAVKSCLMAKQYGLENAMSSLVADACLQAMPSKPADFDVDCIRVAKIPGSGSLTGSYVVNGMVLTRDCLGSEKHKSKVKVAVFGVGLEMTNTETGGSVLLENAEQLMNFTKGEEARMEEFVKSLADAGVGVVVSGGAVQDIALHYCNKYKIMVLKSVSKFELKRLCRTTGATSIVRLGAPLPDELGYAQSVDSVEVGSAKVVVVKGTDGKMATIVMRGATGNMLDEAERAIDDAVNLVRCCCTKSTEFCPGGGASEMAIAREVSKLGESTPGLEQYAIMKFAEALEAVPKVLGANAGLNGTQCVAALQAAHEGGKWDACIDVDGLSSGSLVTSAVEKNILDHLETKKWALRLAIDAALTVLRIDHIIVAKQAGGPKPSAQPNVDDE